MDATDLTQRLKSEARRLGFSLAGACPAVTPVGVNGLHEWLQQGYAGEMAYLSHREVAYHHPAHVLDGARSIVMLAMNYRTLEPQQAVSGQGRVSRYAWGQDYHELIRHRLAQLETFLTAQSPRDRVRGVVDTAPLLEREFAQLAGLGWIGKNTLLLNKVMGSWFFLAALLTTAELDYDTPQEADHCGACTACLDACPTGAFVQPYVLDARRCISYLTIEHRSAIAPDLRSQIGGWVFGCDVCQEVCPWNSRAPLSNERSFVATEGMNPLDLAELFKLDEAAFRHRFRSSPLWRAKRRGLLRNAAIVLGNQRSAAGKAALVRGLNDAESLVRSAAAWALGQYQNAEAKAALMKRLSIETDEDVRQEIQ
jgi:epoxyqueuosine reductase